ncbi:hypothetical protein [Stieleria varia]|uniref:hypothetical protein n=1 Tax=Stieleria varia TaxID=2528005 RepID=UPI0018D25C8F|nr:hypothetical protein [Stieleria varia]
MEISIDRVEQLIGPVVLPVVASFEPQGPTSFFGSQSAWSHCITAERDAYVAIPTLRSG